ncbi:HAD family hydrolase [Clostridium perfringens]|uniref:Phosphoglycolate phosphatase n=1 Tax=Clostridium perfringens TaxID=1502 RepID=A0A127EEH5_CLOPF|nr:MULTISPECIES: HAD hydrolase-like protein [Clostridium]ALG47526.1 Hydrolase, haloacid dehalogenase-like family [Clostridium perfringens]AMN34368.1 phosphoglycolate phosphatase [Clostridium perfringens]EHK2280341.1 HAD hydrolase-like protein [Clostridium perfringens]EHK2364280.1 HAD hydrolase-like protein [Clostridium perfringens]EHK2388895.1 HAD hydrolase-like protein [Clostridium perfringens]
MSNILDNFNKQKDFLICIDSDGCAIDTMDIKHIKCFGPCMVTEWNLEEWKEPILERWNEVNLYTLTRGINRFKGLAVALIEINEKYITIEGLDEFVRWTEETKELSNESLEVEIEKTNNICLKKALEWSKSVNKSIDLLSDDEKCPFEGVKEAIILAKKVADIAIVSSANEKAVLDEWNKHGLLENVDIVLTQNIGSKSYCINKLIAKGYSRNNVLMVGDALGDLKAAEENEALYYPIMVRKEKESWSRFSKEALERFTSNSYYGEYQEKVIAEFKENLSK